MFVNVVFPVARPLMLSYRIIPELEKIIQPGHCVKVPLGKSVRSAIVVSFTDNPGIPEGKVREVIEVESSVPLIPEELLMLCRWAAEYYCCSIGQVFKQFMTGAFQKPKKKRVLLHDDNTDRVRAEFKLTKAQANAADKITSLLKTDSHHVALLHGVTGSGKTLVYISLIREALSSNKSVLVLVPEIGLTGPLHARIAQFISEPIAVLHSNMSAGKRFSNWMTAREGKCRIVIGTRSAVWAPLENLGLIIVDEEHDSSYKQSDGVPRYHGRDLAIYRAYLNSSTIVLGSATPSIESYSNTLSGKYHLIELAQRYGNARMPDVSVVDMREEHKTGNWSFFSKDLIQKIDDRLKKHEQIILLLNRRGYSQLLLCKSCGYIAKCPYCDIATTYHAVDNSLRCHYCGYQTKAPDKCPSCKGIEIKFQGVGVQRVEKEIHNYFPDIRVQRMDADNTRRRKAHADILERFTEKKIDVLIGTQMVAKGLDFPEVTLVGIISADTGLNMPDFRAAENTFQLLSQVAGRSGRGDKPGQVILQTYSPDETCIICAKNHDYKKFYESEKKARESLGYPPFSRLAQIAVSHTSAKILLNSAVKLVTLLKKENRGNTIILGPAPAPIAKQKNRYRMLILLKGASSKAMHNIINKSITQFGLHSVRITVDIDPIFML